jgi:hypothetical protein
MNLQYIFDNSTSPPTQSVLQYAVAPDTVFISTGTQQMYANLTVTVFNPQSYTVICRLFKFGFYVGAQYGDLTTGATGVQTSSDQTSWTISAQATENPDTPTLYQFSAPSAGMTSFQLAPNQSLVFHLNGIQINSAVGGGGALIAITEVTGATPNVINGAITISKEQPTLSIQLFTASPPTPINPGSPLTLNWKVTGSDHQQLYNENTGALLYDSATSSPPLTSYTDYPSRNTAYELIAWAGQLFTVQQANAMVNAPQFIPPDPYASPSPVNPGGQTTLYWTTVHADTVTITAPGFTTVNVPAALGQYTIGSVSAQTTYTLTASTQGISATDIKQVTVTVNLPAPSVTSFTASPVLSNPDGTVTLSWETAYTNSAHLKQKNLPTNVETDLGTVATNQSAYTAHPTGICKYTLGVYGQGGQAQGSVIAAQQQLIPIINSQATALQIHAREKLTSGGRPGMACDLIFDGANVWVANWVSAFKIQAGNGTVLGAYPASSPSPIFTPWALACVPSAGSVYVLSQNDCYVIKLSTADGSLTAAYPGSSFAQPVNFPLGYAIAVDANYIWVAFMLNINPDPGNPNVPLQYNGAYVSKLSAANGSILGTYQIANASQQLIPTSIASDGTNVWVASNFGLTKLSGSDGTILGTYFQQSPPQYGVFDGSNIWVSCSDGTVKQLDGSGNVLKNLQPVTGIQPNMGRPLIAQGMVCVSTASYDSAGTYSQSLQLLQSSDGSVQANFTIAPYFTSYAFDGTCFWLLARDAPDTSVWAIKI